MTTTFLEAPVEGDELTARRGDRTICDDGGSCMNCDGCGNDIGNGLECGRCGHVHAPAPAPPSGIQVSGRVVLVTCLLAFVVAGTLAALKGPDSHNTSSGAPPQGPSDLDAMIGARTLLLREIPGASGRTNPAKVVAHEGPWYIVEEFVGRPPTIAYLVVLKVIGPDRYEAGPKAIVPDQNWATSDSYRAAKALNGWPGVSMPEANDKASR